jgi:hemerythrin superfamily protein
MKATELLRRQHEQVRELYAKHQQTDDDDEKQAIFEEIADNLAAHASIEENLFYPRAFTEGLEEQLREAVEEHLAIKRELADLLSMVAGDENFDAKLKVAMEIVDHHVDEEENELFPQVEKAIDGSELERLGLQMEQMFEEVMDDGPSDAIPLETEQAASLK